MLRKIALETDASVTVIFASCSCYCCCYCCCVTTKSIVRTGSPSTLLFVGVWGCVLSALRQILFSSDGILQFSEKIYLYNCFSKNNDYYGIGSNVTLNRIGLDHIDIGNLIKTM